MTNPFPSIYYVYKHIDPDTRDVVYIGKGSGGRAWDTSRNRKTSHPAHFEWIQQQLGKGLTPNDYVTIVSQGLTNSAAIQLEANLQHLQGRPKFNRQSGELNYQAKLTDEQAIEIFRSKEKHGVLAKEYGVSRSAISMIKSRKQWRATTACCIQN